MDICRYVLVDKDDVSRDYEYDTPGRRNAAYAASPTVGPIGCYSPSGPSSVRLAVWGAGSPGS